MAAVPVIINGVMMPKGKSADDEPIPAVFLGWASIQGLSVGGGPVIPPETTPPDPPVDPPTEPPSGSGVAVVIKAAPETGGWGLATQAGGEFTWYYVPGQSGAGPKR
jgi:hypothetical protein